MKREKLKITHYVALVATFAGMYKMWSMFSSDLFDELERDHFRGWWHYLFLRLSRFVCARGLKLN